VVVGVVEPHKDFFLVGVVVQVGIEPPLGLLLLLELLTQLLLVLVEVVLLAG
jgi:hypothetical protein